MTRMERYLSGRGISVRKVALRTINPRTKKPYSKTHIYSVATGSTDPTRECMNAIVRATRLAASDRSITVADLFDIEAGRAKRVS